MPPTSTMTDGIATSSSLSEAEPDRVMHHTSRIKAALFLSRGCTIFLQIALILIALLFLFGFVFVALLPLPRRAHPRHRCRHALTLAPALLVLSLRPHRRRPPLLPSPSCRRCVVFIFAVARRCRRAVALVVVPAVLLVLEIVLTPSTPVLALVRSSLPLVNVRLTVALAPDFIPALASDAMLVVAARFSRVPQDW
ncbi:hypothetical protein DFH94DRAFT_796499 [Russula ochroleuca]|uniref:Uncharacterized protein n=1 Tax=Russula ochroleuca TaxID=152965 RepID=A0A9P5N4W3_9AGAM|nr:hypothetical protein DFH94DRAFT_796499 [Russula ochroleuca]